jgi:hypothetical protein
LLSLEDGFDLSNYQPTEVKLLGFDLSNYQPTEVKLLVRDKIRK